jgi:signal transduction histidine kinase
MSNTETRQAPVRVEAAALQEIANVLDTGAVVVDEQLIVRVWNRWMESASGLTSASVVGKPITDVLSIGADSIAVRSFHRALNGEPVVLAHQFHQFVFPLPAPAGFPGMEKMQQNARFVPHSLESGAGALALVQDVTERVARERELSEARENAESASKAKSEFLAAISHELRTPLTAVLGYADLLQSEIGGSLNEIQHDHIARITAGTWHLIKIIEEILSFSRVEAKKYEVTLEPVNVGDIVNQTAALLQQQAALKRIALDIHMPEPAQVIETDPLKLRQILLNLLGNAIKFTDSGSVTVDVRIVGETLQCRVIDTGPGVPARSRKVIFEPFVQADQSTTRAKGGTGLGLALSRSLAELLGGELVLESTGPQGSVFKLTLPLRHLQGTRTLAM